MPDTYGTIVAEATPPGRGGVSVLRLSGPQSGTILRRIFSPGPQLAPWDKPRYLSYGKFVDFEGRPVDRGLAVYFAAPASFTGEDVAECHLHGSPAVIHAVKQACVALGARPALPGEFSYRAVLNGRMGVMEAETVNEMVSFETALQAETAGMEAASSLQGRLEAIRARLQELIASWEARLEFPDDFSKSVGLPEAEELGTISVAISELLAASAASRPLRRGWRIALCGAPNVGKSSLFNAILQRERALVTPHPGTTRDVLEEMVDINGLPVVFLDTAGVRDSADPAEKLGVKKGLDAARTADGVLLLYEKPCGWGAEEAALASAVGGNVVAVVETKSDLTGAVAQGRPATYPWFSVSCITGDGLPALVEHLAGWAMQMLPSNAPVLVNERQRAALARVSEGLCRAEEALGTGQTEEVAIAGLGLARVALDDVLGHRDPEELYDMIFSSFCIGK